MGNDNPYIYSEAVIDGLRAELDTTKQCLFQAQEAAKDLARQLAASRETTRLMYDHEAVRKQVWMNAWTATATAITCKEHKVATDWANSALAAFDAQFKESR